MSAQAWVFPALSFTGQNISDSVKSYVRSVQGKCLELNESSQDPADVILFRTTAIDHLMTMLYVEAERLSRERLGTEASCCLVAQGGYGRSELCLHSDIDLLFLYEGKAQGFIKVLTEQILHPLWDAGLELGFATRTLRDCKKMMEDDITILTALIDARWLAGSPALYDEFIKMFQRYFGSEKNRLKFVQKKMEENDERLRRYGESSYLLEPNLKEGRGGLRDYHSIHWFARVMHGVSHPRELVAKGLLSPQEFSELAASISFLWKVRNELHYLSGRKHDQLNFEYQEAVAARLNFLNTEHFLGVELFMQQYHQRAAGISRIADRFTALLIPNRPKLFPQPKPVVSDDNLMVVVGKLTIAHSDVFTRDPLYLLKVFDTSRQESLELDNFTIDKIREHLHLIDDEFRKDVGSGALFRQILRNPKGLYDLLAKMHELKVLGALLPEFAKLLFRVQHDAYHVYTVDAHSLYAVREAERLFSGESSRYVTPSQAIKDLADIDLLMFAILYHDIGKGEGSGHVEKGAPLIRQAAERLGFSSSQADLLEFLERSHLIMTHLAFRRDLEEQDLIIQFARSMQTLERLNLLYLLTFCDVRGVSPEAMTDWKASLLEYLYLRTREVLTKGAFEVERAKTLLPQIREAVLKQAKTVSEQTRCTDFFNMMAVRYLLATAPTDIYRHFWMWEQFEENPIVVSWRILEKERLNEVTLFTLNHPGLSSKVAGVLAGHQINILDAGIALSNKGHALLSFHVTDAEGGIIEDEIRHQRFEADLREVLAGQVPIKKFVQDNLQQPYLQKKQVRRLPTKIVIDNDVSAYYTVIDVYAHDRIGILYQIISTLESLGLYLEISKVSTKVDQVSDVFYVKDIFGHKITSEEKLKNIKAALESAVS